jgi:hypothetical protein
LRLAEAIPYNLFIDGTGGAWRGEPEPFRPARSIALTTKEETLLALTCPSCGNDQKFLVKTLQMHVVSLENGRMDVSEEGRPNLLEVLCDECETALNFDDVEEGLRRELLLTLGAR